MVQYTALFRIECLHEYFGGGPCPSLALAPTEDCRQMLARYQMLFRPSVGGGVVYGPRQSPPDVFKQFDETAPFTFTLASTDPGLNSYTDVDLNNIDISKTVFHFDNRKDYAGEAFGQPRQLLHPPGKPFAGGVIPEESAARRWGLVSIYAGGIDPAQQLPEDCRVIDQDGTIHPRTFTIALGSRKTFWRYYIIPSAEKQDFGHYELITSSRKAPAAGNAESETPFALLPGTTPVDGRNAWVFESKTQLPFLLSPADAFSVSLRPSKNGKLGQRAIRLPYAQPTSVGFKPNPEADQKTTPEMCSEIFVYV